MATQAEERVNEYQVRAMTELKDRTTERNGEARWGFPTTTGQSLEPGLHVHSIRENFQPRDRGPTRTNEKLDADEVIHLVCKDLIDILHMVQGNCHPWIRAKISKFLELYALFLIIMSQSAPIPMDKIKHIP